MEYKFTKKDKEEIVGIVRREIFRLLGIINIWITLDELNKLNRVMK